jgi:hypothetical protein
MELSLEDYEALVLSMRPWGTRRPSEKRLHLRVSADAQVTIIPLITGKKPVPMTVHVADVSRHGVGIRHSQPLSIGQNFILCLSLEQGTKTRAIICVVKQVKKVKPRSHHMGCEFIDHAAAEVPSDQVLPGLKRYQVARFKEEERMLYEA